MASHTYYRQYKRALPERHVAESIYLRNLSRKAPRIRGQNRFNITAQHNDLIIGHMDLCRTGPAANLRYVTNSATSGFCRALHLHVRATRLQRAKLLALVCARFCNRRSLFASWWRTMHRASHLVFVHVDEQIERTAAPRNTSLAFEEVRQWSFVFFVYILATSNPRDSRQR